MKGGCGTVSGVILEWGKSGWWSYGKMGSNSQYRPRRTTSTRGQSKVEGTAVHLLARRKEPARKVIHFWWESVLLLHSRHSLFGSTVGRYLPSARLDGGTVTYVTTLGECRATTADANESDTAAHPGPIPRLTAAGTSSVLHACDSARLPWSTSCAVPLVVHARRSREVIPRGDPRSA